MEGKLTLQDLKHGNVVDLAKAQPLQNLTVDVHEGAQGRDALGLLEPVDQPGRLDLLRELEEALRRLVGVVRRVVALRRPEENAAFDVDLEYLPPH